MSAEPYDGRPADREAHPLALLAAVVLALTGLAFVGGGAWLAAEGLGKIEPSGGLREGMIAIGVVGVAVGALKLWAAWRISIHRHDGRGLGLVIAATGTLLGGVGAFVAVGGLPARYWGDYVGLLLPVPYVIVLLGLILGRRHFGLPNVR
jgi:hypothetical protein